MVLAVKYGETAIRSGQTHEEPIGLPEKKMKKKRGVIIILPR
jgi:hypothetical protein